MHQPRQVSTKAASTPAPRPAHAGLLQRTCACGNHTAGGGECEGCKKKRQGLLQRAAVSAPDDAYEVEANQIADRVMAAPADQAVSGGPLRVQRVVGQPAGRMEQAPASVDRALAGPGRPLEPALRQGMEQRFGYDFSRVRVHAGDAAAQSARDVRAYAYTLGHDIVFGAGQYDPGTQRGRRLIAHELTHVVQQEGAATGGVIRRLGPGDESFVIRGLPADREERPNFVFFQLNDATVPAVELHKIEEFADANGSATRINLYGYASEEGDELENADLISDRLESVRSELARFVDASVVITVTPRRAAGIRQLDYRSFRSVEMSIGVSAIGAAASNTRTVDCATGQHDTIDTTRAAAIAQVDGAISQLNAYRSDTSANPEVQSDLDNNFHSHSTATVSTLLHHLRQVRTDLSGLSGNTRRRCATPEYNPCAGAIALTRRPQVTFCPSYFFAGTADPQRLTTLIHEMCHYALFDADDRAYNSERVLPFLSTAEALDNADSIANFVQELNLPPGERVTSTQTTPSEDTVEGCGTDERAAREALAWAQRWNTYAFFGMSQTYNNWATFMFPFIVARLGPITSRYMLAGIFDRYSSLDTEFQGDFTMECVASDNDACVSPITLDVASRTFVICPAFFTQSLRNRIISLYAEVTRLVPEIRDDQRRAYAELARDYKIEYWGLPPT